jgi:flagellar biosynthesis protein FlhF
MNIKSYFAGSVDAAVRRARAELGEDALLLNSKPAPPEARHLGAVEVVFASKPESGQPSAGGRAGEIQPHDILLEVAALRRQIEQFGSALLRDHAFASTGRLTGIASRLAAMEMAPDLIPEILTRLDAASGSSIADAIAAMLPCREPSPDLPRAIAVIGPAGSGKTTALVKIAVRDGLASRRSGAFVSADGSRIGGADQLRSYAAILGVPFEAVLADELEVVLPQHAARQRVWIDTAGLTSADDGVEAIAAAFRRHPQVERHFVVAATLRYADLARLLDRYSLLAPTHLVATHLDEANCLGPIVSASIRNRLPVSYLSTGARIPDDLLETNPQQLAALACEPFEVMRGRRQAA